jgi:hypothetical protein
MLEFYETEISIGDTAILNNWKSKISSHDSTSLDSSQLITSIYWRKWMTLSRYFTYIMSEHEHNDDKRKFLVDTLSEKVKAVRSLIQI